MIFGAIAVVEAEGCVLVHSVRTLERRLPKGHCVTRADMDLLLASGISTVIAVRLEDGDVGEDIAAEHLAKMLVKDGMVLSPASTGRVNLHASVNGVFVADKAVVDALNRVDAAMTLACLADHTSVFAGDMVATVKIIPLAVAGSCLEAAMQVAASGTAMAIKPYTAHRVGLIATQLPSLKPSVMDKTRQVMDVRLQASGSRIETEVRVAHNAQAVADALAHMIDDHDLVIVFGASAVADPRDVIPEAIRVAGGQVEHIGMPVDPGNLMVTGSLGGKPVIGAPGCARSPKENGFDWVLNRLLCGERPGFETITGMGVGGLLMEIPTRPKPRAIVPDIRPGSVGIVLLAAGQASRMGADGRHKLLSEFDGIPLVRKTAQTALQAKADSLCVVTGHRAGEIEAVLADLPLEMVRNADYASGMASSLKAGLATLEDDVDGMMVLLADMPGITGDDLRKMLDVFRREEGKVIVRAVAGGKRGNPVILPRSTFEAVSRLQGDVGARHIIEKSDLPVVEVEIGVAAHLDVDTPEAVLAAGGVLKQ
jgi:molybdenum cofactor cytidylyltransferase